MIIIKKYIQKKCVFGFINRKNSIIFQNYNAVAKPWIKLGSLIALASYIGQLACQFLIVSGLCLAHPSPLGAMEGENSRDQYSYLKAFGVAGTSQRQESMASTNLFGEHPKSKGFEKNQGTQTIFPLLRKGSPTLDDIKQESLKLAMKEGKIGPRHIPGWQLHDVADLGNCFYDSIAHQMKLLGHNFLKTVPVETLPRDSLRLRIQGFNFKDEEWAGDKEIEEFVKNFGLILAIVDTRNPEYGYVYYYLGTDSNVLTKHPHDNKITLPDKPIIRLAATGNHFLSVVSEAPEERHQAVMENINASSNKDVTNKAQSLNQKPMGDLNSSMDSSSVKPSPSSMAALSDKNTTDLAEFYKDSDHPLTHEFWKEKDLSDRLKQVRTNIEELKKEFISLKKKSIEVGNFYLKDLEQYKNIFKYPGSESELALIGCNLYLISENNVPNALEAKHTPAIIQLAKHTYDLLVNKPDGIKRISNPGGINLSDLDAFFQNYHAQGKYFLAWNDPIMQYITSKGGHSPLISLHGQPINFSIKNIKGGSGCDLTILSRNETNFIAVKHFSNVEEGVNELLYSLVALDINPSPKELKMARIYDAILYPENCFNLIMEGANTHVIHHFLSEESAANVAKACAEYFAKFHLRNYLKMSQNIDEEKYISHAARSARTLKGNPLKEDNQEKPPLRLLRGNQWTGDNLENIKSYNIVRLLSEREQENFVSSAKNIHYKFEENCNKIFRSLKSRDAEKQEPYFLTITHGDAHGNNFFYNNDEKLNGHEISKDSFQRVTMIDVGKIVRSYGNIGDPAEDVGRFLGSLWDWFFLQNYTEAESLVYYKKIENLQNKFIKLYLKNIKDGQIFTEDSQGIFEDIFTKNCNFYKLRFYSAVFNFTKDKDEKKDKEIKMRVLKSWMEENATENSLLQDYSQPNILKKESKDRPWKRVDGDMIRWLPDRVEGFIESAAEGSDKSYLTLLWEELHSTGSATLSSKSAIAGMGGIGKTSLALEYAHEALNHKAYNLVYWLLSGTEFSLLKGYRNLLRDMGVSAKDKDDDDVIALIKQRIPEKGRCLLIYDNVPNPEFLKDKTPSGTHILVTSRYREGWDKQPLSLDVFRPEDAIQYLIGITGLEASPDNQDKAGKLAEALGYFPLSLSHAAHYIKLIWGNRVSGDSFEKYLQDFRREPADHFEERQNPFKTDELEMTYENLIGKTYSLSSQYISGLAKRLMLYCSYLDPDSIAEDIFLEGRGDKKEELSEAFGQLANLSLINKIQEQPLFSIHRLVQLVVRNEQERIEASQKDKVVLPDICRLFNNLFKTNTYSAEQIDKLLNYLPHILMVYDHSKRLKVSSQEVESLGWIGKVLYSIGLLNVIGKSLVLSQENQSLKQENGNNTKKLLQILFKARDIFKGPVSDDVPDWLTGVAKESYPAVQTALGAMYEQNIFVNQDDGKAISWYTKAANQEYAEAQSYLGSMCAEERGVPQSDTDAVTWFTLAANQGHADAQWKMVIMYHQGRGVKQSDEDAVTWCTLTANQGIAQAQCNLGVMYANGLGVPQSDEKAVEWYQLAANQGHAGAQYNLGNMYLEGWGVPQSDTDAVTWFTLAANQGDANAQCNLGVMYANGLGVPQSDEKAVEWYQLAADHGHADAQCNLVLMYGQGRGIRQ